MAVDYDSFTPQERDNFVKNLLREPEIAAIISTLTHGGKVFKTEEQILEFCFKVAVKKMDRLKKAIVEKRTQAEGE